MSSKVRECQRFGGKVCETSIQRKGNRVAILSELGINIQQISKGKKFQLTIHSYNCSLCQDAVSLLH